MGDPDPTVSRPRDDFGQDPQSKPTAGGEPNAPAFHSQLEYLAQHHLAPGQQAAHVYGHQPYDMSSMAANLPQASLPPLNTRPSHPPNDGSGVLSPVSVYQMQQASQYAAGRPQPYDPTSASRAQQQQYLPYAPYPHQSNIPGRQPITYQAQGQYGPLDPYGYAYSPVHMQPVDPRFASHGSYGMQFAGDPSLFARRASEPSAVPSFPRGPPRKPKQSGHALWVGNLPPAATVTDLKDHFSRDATKDIESLFLISKSNCAFVNYRSESACVAAMNRFHDSRFHGVRLVCRLRRGSAASAASSTLLTPTPVDASGPSSSSDSPIPPPSPALAEEPSSPTIVGSSSVSSSTPAATPSIAPEEPQQRASEKYFIVKSLTVQDLEASVRNGTWATQSHNEVALNRAYDETENVYLIFSANKSGEYFGYARMASSISGNPVSLVSNVTQDEPVSPGAPQSIPTPATATAPKGRIIDDSARGTIFWEAELSDAEDEESPSKETSEGSGNQNWGRQFSIEWLSTARLPFYRTRGLRNPWNANREVKIARDGTELEPSVGRRLVQMFHRPSPGVPMHQPGMPMN